METGNERVAAHAKPGGRSFREIRKELASLVLLSFGGFLLHMRLHPVSFDPASPENPAHVIPFIMGILGMVAVPALLSNKITAIAGYLLNGMSVIIGSIVMAHLSLAGPPRPLSVSGIFTFTTIPYIAMLIPKLLIGQRVLLYYYPRGKGRMFTTGWWVRHCIYLAAFYILGYVVRR